jgi:hypothetical protein
MDTEKTLSPDRPKQDDKPLVPQAILSWMRTEGNPDIFVSPQELEPHAAEPPTPAANDMNGTDDGSANASTLINLLNAIQGTEIAAQLQNEARRGNGHSLPPVLAEPEAAAEAALGAETPSAPAKAKKEAGNRSAVEPKATQPETTAPESADAGLGMGGAGEATPSAENAEAARVVSARPVPAKGRRLGRQRRAPRPLTIFMAPAPTETPEPAPDQAAQAEPNNGALPSTNEAAETTAVAETAAPEAAAEVAETTATVEVLEPETAETAETARDDSALSGMAETAETTAVEEPAAAVAEQEVAETAVPEAAETTEPAVEAEEPAIAETAEPEAMQAAETPADAESAVESVEPAAAETMEQEPEIVEAAEATLGESAATSPTETAEAAEAGEALPVFLGPMLPALLPSTPVAEPAEAAGPASPSEAVTEDSPRVPIFARIKGGVSNIVSNVRMTMERIDQAELRVETWFQDWFGPPDPRRTARTAKPPLVAYHWIVDSRQALEIANISAGGLYLLTEDRWTEGNIVSMTLQRTDKAKGAPDSWIAVDFVVTRWCDDGLAGAFLPSPPGMSYAAAGRAENTADKRALEHFVKQLTDPDPVEE